MLVNTDKLRGIIAENKKDQTDVAKMIGITPKIFYQRIQKGIFGSDYSSCWMPASYF